MIDLGYCVINQGYVRGARSQTETGHTSNCSLERRYVSGMHVTYWLAPGVSLGNGLAVVGVEVCGVQCTTYE